MEIGLHKIFWYENAMLSLRSCANRVLANFSELKPCPRFAFTHFQSLHLVFNLVFGSNFSIRILPLRHPYAVNYCTHVKSIPYLAHPFSSFIEVLEEASPC